MTDMPEMRGVRGVSPDVCNHPHSTVSAASTLRVQSLANLVSGISVTASGTRRAPGLADCYSGIAEFSVYVERAARGTGAGRAAMQGLIEAATHAGYWKLLSHVFTENQPSRALLARLGFREVGLYEQHAQHAQLGNVWRDCLIVEKLLHPTVEPAVP